MMAHAFERNSGSPRIPWWEVDSLLGGDECGLSVEVHEAVH